LKLTDRERVLLNIAVETAGSVHDSMERLQHGWTLRMTFGRPAAQFVPRELANKLEMPLKPGDIVRCRTNPNHAWGISEFVEQTGYSDFLLRVIGGPELLRMGNEDLDVLRFMRPEMLYTGKKHQMYRWAHKAFQERYNPKGDYFKRCGGVEFDGDRMVWWSRAHIWQDRRDRKGEPTLHAQPRRFEMQWSNKTRLKDTIAAMLEQGFAEAYEFTEEEPTRGNAGKMSFTADSLRRDLASAGVDLP